MAAHTSSQFITFMSQLKDTNASLGFYCNFDKINSNVEAISMKLNQLNYLIGQEDIEILLSGKTFLGLSVLVKIDLNLLFLRIIGYYRSFLVKISAFYNAYGLKLKTKLLDE